MTLLFGKIHCQIGRSDTGFRVFQDLPVDYKVRVVNAQAGTAARVVIETRDDENLWGTVGVSENIIEASWQALVDSIEYKLIKDHES